MMTAATKEALQAPAGSAVDDRLQRFSDLEEILADVVTWASLLDKVVDDMSRLPGMSRREVNIAHGQLDRLNDALKEAIQRLDATYHQRTKEEASDEE
jgi:hypothetical protein